MEIIDIHAHIYPEKIAQRATAAIGEFYGEKMQVRAGTAERLIFEGAAAGITRYAVHSVATVPRQVRAINEFIAGEVARHAELIGFITLHQDLTEAEIDSEIAWGLKNGFKGIKLHPDFQRFKPDDPKCMKIFELCEGRLPVLVHTGDARYDFSNPARIVPVLSAFPTLTLIGAHFGGWSVWDDAEEALTEYPNFYVDTSSSLYALSPERAARLLRKYGAHRVLFGTDYPMWRVEDELARMETLGLTEEEKELVFYQNAARLFGFPTV